MQNTNQPQTLPVKKYIYIHINNIHFYKSDKSLAGFMA